MGITMPDSPPPEDDDGANRLNGHAVEDEPEPIVEAIDGPPPEDDDGGGVDDIRPYSGKRIVANPHFQYLGFDGETFYYLPKNCQQVVPLAANAHGKLNLIRLAPSKWWYETYKGARGTNWGHAAESCFQESYARAIYDPRKVRGCGAWIDKDRVVFHTGKRLIVDGVETIIAEMDTEYIYEQKLPLKNDQVPPATAQDGMEIMRLAKMFNWKYPLSGELLAGWCFIAPICGILPWRPGVWVNGPKGSGKTWIIENFVSPMLGENKVKVAGSSTEPGIRQELGSNALPVEFDEAEAKDPEGQKRLQKIMDLFRSCTSDGGDIKKGTASGKAMSFKTRSCFLFASIGVAAIEAADVSRISNLELFKRADGGEHFSTVKAARFGPVLSADDFFPSIRVRALKLARVIMHNAGVFSAAVAARVGDSRVGDQMGALLAGAYNLCMDGPISRAAADAWVAKQDWSGHEQGEADAEENKALSALVEAHYRDGHDTVTLGELICKAFRIADDDPTAKANEACVILARVGIKIIYKGMEIGDKQIGEGVAISNNHSYLRAIYKDTHFADKWKDSLGRVKGAIHCGGVRIGNSTQRAVKLPRSAFE